MRQQNPVTTTTFVQITQSISQCLTRLLEKRCLDDAALDDLAAVRHMLETLPLSTDDFGLACTRLRNARHYLRYTEPGAARYELRLLATSLTGNHTLMVGRPGTLRNHA
jgi:hypothetical protein